MTTGKAYQGVPSAQYRVPSGNGRSDSALGTEHSALTALRPRRRRLRMTRWSLLSHLLERRFGFSADAQARVGRCNALEIVARITLTEADVRRHGHDHHVFLLVLPHVTDLIEP